MGDINIGGVPYGQLDEAFEFENTLIRVDAKLLVINITFGIGAEHFI